MYSLVTLGQFLTSINLNPKLDQESSSGVIVLVNETESDEAANYNQQGFCQRLKHEIKVIVETLKIKIIWQYIVFWLAVGITPSFGGIGYFQIIDTYQITDIEYGYIVSMSTFTLLLGTVLYKILFSKFECRTCTRIAYAIDVFSLFIDLFQAYRINIKMGISDMTVIMFSSAITGSLNFALTQLPMLVLV